MSTEKRAPVKYTVLEKSLVGNEIFEAGQTCEYDGLPSANLAPTCDEGKARAAEYEVSNAARIAKMCDQFGESSVGEAGAFAKAVAAAIAASNEGQDERIADAVASAIAKVFPNGTGKKAVDPAPDTPIA